MITNEPQDRKVIPYWRSVTFALKSLELEPVNAIKNPIVFDERFLEQRAEEWRENRGLSFALDLIGSAIVYGNHELAKDAATFILNEGRFISPLVRRASKKILGDSDRIEEESLPPKEIGIIRKSLARFPLNPYYWVDLSLLYAQNGLWKKAERPMKVALQLAPYDRHIIRAAVRFWISDPKKPLEQEKYGLHILRKKKDIILRNPWLLATEIAASDHFGKSSRFIKRGIEMLDRYPLSHIPELAASIATLESKSGSHRKGNQLFRKSAKAPNDNTIAQLVWAKSNARFADDLSPILRENRNAHEANFNNFFNEGEWRAAVKNAISWKKDQPFALKPYQAVSYLACELLEDFKQARKISEEGLKKYPQDNSLFNNRVYSLLRDDKCEKASEVLSKSGTIKFDPISKICLIANRGLLDFRRGKIPEGRDAYKEVVSQLKGDKDNRDTYLASAYINWTREEFRHRTNDWHSLLERAKSLVKRLPKSDKKATITSLHLLEQEIKKERK